MKVDAIIACAMEEEAAPFLAAAPHQAIGDRLWTASLGGQKVAIMVTGIGLVNAAMRATAPGDVTADLYILAGSCGGIGESVRVGDVVAGTVARYLHADATAFGYQLGQIPGMPVEYRSPFAGKPLPADHSGLVLSGNSFVTADNVPETIAEFPGILAVDMETTAAAQVKTFQETAWLSLRAVSDLCGPRAGEDFHMGLDTAAANSRDAVIALLEGI